MLEMIFNKLRNAIRKLDMRWERAKYGYIEKLPPDIHYFDGSMYDALYEASCKWPHNTALEYGNREFTYRELIKKIDRVARSLKAIGIKKGDRVTICMPNTPEAVAMFYAINEVGAVANMVHPLSSEAEMANFLKKSHSKAMLCIDAAYPRVEPIIKQTEVEHLIVISATRSMELIVKIIYWLTKGRKNHIKRSQHTMLWDTFLLQGNKYVGNPHTRVNSNDLAVILYSGGTTGSPKGVMLSNLNFNAEALISRYYGPEILKTKGSFLTFLPNFHAFGLGICTHIPLYWGMRVILIPQFNAKKLKSYIKKYRFSVLCGVPAVFEAMTHGKFGKKDLKSLTTAISGGDAISLPEKQKINQFFRDHGSSADLRVGYGLTEASGVVAFSPKGINDADIIGYALPDCKFYIEDLKTHQEAAPGQDGEILIYGPTTMLGYLDNKKETAAVFTTIKGRKYLRTGDIGFIDKKGLLHFKSRLKRVIITNGYNVYPSQVEAAILRAKSVAKCAVVGIPNSAHGETIKAFIVLKDDADARSSRTEIAKVLKKHLAKYEIPREYRYVANLPLTKMNKIDYNALIDFD